MENVRLLFLYNTPIYSFFDISEIRDTERVVKEMGFQHLIPCVFKSKIGALVSSSVYSPAAQTSKSESDILTRIPLPLIQNKLFC